MARSSASSATTTLSQSGQSSWFSNPMPCAWAYAAVAMAASGTASMAISRSSTVPVTLMPRLVSQRRPFDATDAASAQQARSAP